ncbi:carboxypeptidase-like regulatory domain-containing protein [Sediminibacterium sp.]|uniref:carboxypeptidase-like regulatory domain-containing protein n=1 Tax=Sediminibacterium sp. TaxID=1917865 RepID=UPI003F718078
MRHNLFVVIWAFLTIFGCKPSNKAQTGQITQGISGFITELKGNQMPMKGAPENKPRPVSVTLLVYEPTNLSQVQRVETSALYTSINTRKVASVLSDSTGAFSVALPPGTYSLFVRQGKFFFANSFDSQNNIQLVTVEANKVTPFNITINSGATY